ncbi:Putative heterokaryon incompatibility [Septoria linicola]|uniref:Heterokaryon incompatibility n=1 Tax=Septoria linicola TaxID=215465 RepID=A0A9Q9AZB8_9PEZI|nr:Putative heterokaryon incompatibility [Septoria linicola]
MAFYHPLNFERKEIRVLVLCPGLLDDVVQARLQVVSLSGPGGSAQVQHYSDTGLLARFYRQTRGLLFGPAREQHESHSDFAYEAVSYCWGRQKSFSTIKLNGMSFEAPASAIDVLRYLRFRGIERTLWIDAICINQQDIEERESQVMMMGSIYRAASRTVVWLGPAKTYTQAALELAVVIWNQLPEDLMTMSPADFRTAIRKVKLPNDTNVKTMNGIFQLEWFYRQWVLQEVVTTKHHICYIGSQAMKWLGIELLTVWAHETKQWENLRSIPALPCLTSSIRRGAPLYQSLSALALQSRKLLSTDPKDKIFALLSMTRWAERGEAFPVPVRPNYRESLKLCMCRATKAMIIEDEDLSVLEEAETEPYGGPIGCYMQQEDMPWPSWCPPWHIPRSETKMVIHRLSGSWYVPHDSRSTPKRWKSLIQDEGDCILTLQGFTVDLVSQSVPTYSLNSTKIRNSIPTEDIFDLESQAKPALRLNSLLEVVSAGRVSLDDNYGAETEEKTFDEIKREILTRQAGDDAEEVVGSNSAYPKYSLFGASAARALFVTQSGRLGLGSMNMKSGDKVVVFYGSAWPFVLATEAEHYRLVGPCYLQGKMNDDLLAEFEALGRAAENFEIR